MAVAWKFLTIALLSLDLGNFKCDAHYRNTWFLGMNLNPSDGHIMSYETGWDDGNDIGSKATALTKDYLSSTVWNMPVNRIAIVRHQKGLIEAAKVWEFKQKGNSMLERFKAMDPGREIATTGGPKQVFMVRNMDNNVDDPIFSVSGDIAINWRYADNGNRIALTGGHLSKENVDDDNTHGLGNHYAIDPKTGLKAHSCCGHEISNIQDCPLSSCNTSKIKVQGSDHGTYYKNGSVYGNYAIYVSHDAKRFPIYRKKLMLQMKE